MAKSTQSIEYKEWTNPYNAFNSMKVLLWRDHLEAAVKGEFLPPVIVDTDLTNLCNLNCIWCNSQEFRRKAPYSQSTEHLLKLADFYKDMRRWSFHSQIFFLSRRLRHHH